MKRLNPCLLTMALLFTLMHAGHFAYEYLQQPFGAYFASGVLILNTSKTLAFDSRLQFQEDGVYEYQQSGEWSRNAFRRIESSLWGSLKLVTASAQASPASSLIDAPIDNDLAFDHAYYIKKGTPLTLYRLPTPPESICVYVRELSRIRCLGMQRPKGHRQNTAP